MSPTTRRLRKAAGGEDEPEDTVTIQPPAEPDPDHRETDEEKAERVRREAKQLDRDLWSVVGHMAASLLVYGGIGYGLGRWLGHPILLLVGVVFGLVLSLTYTIWLVNRGGRLK